MTFSVANIAKALAGYLRLFMPDLEFYTDPRQQKTKLPGAFIQLISSSVVLRQSRYLLRSLRFDLTYLDDYNKPDLQRHYQAVSELFDLNLELIPVAPDSSELLHTYDRSADIDLDGLHYKFELRVWLSPEEDAELMRTLEIKLEVKDG